MFLTLQSIRSNAGSILNSLIKELKIPVSYYTIKNELENHPDYPSLLAISDCLTNWKVPHQAYKIDKMNFKTEEFSYPFVAHLTDEGGKFILVHEVNDEKIKYTDEKISKQILTRNEFLENWDGIILYAEKEENSGEANYNAALTQGVVDTLRVPFLLAIVLTGLFTMISFSNPGMPYLTVLALKLMGLVVSVLLVTQSIDARNPFVQNLCSLGKKNDCNAILKSDAAKLTNWLSWSEVGMFYFFGSFTCLLFNPASVVLLAWLSLACLPYTFYSIGYQFRLKNWCVLCCTIQALLWIEALVLVFNYPLSSFSFDPVQWISIIFCFSFPIGLWTVLKPILLKSNQSNLLKRQLKKFKYNSDLFNQLLTNQPRYRLPEELMPVRLGNQNAETTITMISNPFCGPCASTHKLLEEWLETREDIQLKVVFATANQDSDNRTKVARHITALSLLEDKEIVKTALNDWYAQSSKKYEAWAERYPVTLDKETISITEVQSTWCKQAKIHFTPTILINGYKLVEPYQLEDIKYLLA